MAVPFFLHVSNPSPYDCVWCMMLANRLSEALQRLGPPSEPVSEPGVVGGQRVDWSKPAGTFIDGCSPVIALAVEAVFVSQHNALHSLQPALIPPFRSLD